MLSEALSTPENQAPPHLAAELSRFRATQARLWSGVRWENDNKETMWRLAVDGVPLPGNTHLARVPIEACGCGAYGEADAGRPCSPRLHHFWECPVARAVREQIDRHLPPPQAAAGATTTRQQLWLAQAPPGCEQAPWDVIALAALSAMEVGRCCLRAATRRQGRDGAAAATGQQQQQQQQQVQPQPEQPQRQGPRQRAITDFFAREGGATQQEGPALNAPAGESPTQEAGAGEVAAGEAAAAAVGAAAAAARGAAEASPLDRARARAVTDFWARLRSFAALETPRHGWDRVGPQHPILAVVEERMRCAAPVEITA
ncbi:hypothetical protein PLESTB_001292900 [Pleodorina starrii]|uniref:Uncharacterized protein n=1 Tax=Pleodorina starrii TaxID=330485 RepID=A0A9W6BTI0_9CHLO|nr:hypothetical protein PLESTM_000956100 [Pleodorina starrii]GLC57947.1 hypothetical protein PLESTB_001292900 [Pleodorina starrii]